MTNIPELYHRKRMTRIMKLSLILLLMRVSFVFATNLNAQVASVTISVNKSEAKSVIEQIEAQTDYLFVYNNAIDLSNEVTMDVAEASVAEVLSTLFSDTDIVYVVEGNNILLLEKSSSATRNMPNATKSDSSNSGRKNIITSAETTVLQQSGKSVTGKVKDSFGDPVVGANVVEKGVVNGVVTDVDGNFSLSVSANATIVVSYIGYNTVEIPVLNKNTFTVELKEDLLKLDEIVVVGYGTARKNDLTGSVVRADIGALKESPNVNLLGALQGLVPGLNVGAAASAGEDPRFSIRGRTSISGTTTPLIVLDGIIYRGNLVDINMNDVESIDVLKDASASAIYGSQASNGVVLITTKTGTAKSKPIISYSGYVSYQQPTNNAMHPENRDGFLRKVADRFLDESRIGDDMLQMNPAWDPSKYMMDRNALDGYKNGTETDWWDLLTNDTPYIQSHNLSVRGKSDLSGYFFSMGYTDQENLIINDKYKRYNLRVNLDMKITDWLKVGVQSAFTVSDKSGTSPTMSNLMTLPPLVAARDNNEALIKQPYKTIDNPLLQIEENDLDKRYNLSGNFFADIKIPFIKGLNYRMNFAQYLKETKDYNFNRLANNFQGEGYKENESEYSWTQDNILSYRNTFGKHDFDATLLYGVERIADEKTKGIGKYFANDILGYNKLDAAQADQQSITSGAWEESSMYSMGRIRYTFDERYTFTGTVRRDGFSGFGANYKFGVFPSAAIAWRINQEKFMQKITCLDNLKLRLSFGKNGNRTIERYQTLARLKAGNGYVYGDGASPEQRQWLSSLANADLKWETTNTLNIGVDFSVLNSRIFGNMEYYISNTTNLLYNIDIPEINGLASIPMNIGKMGNKGFELSVTGVPVKTKDFSWTVTFNYSTNRNKIKRILGIDSDGDGKEDDLIANKIFIGKPYGVCYDYNITGMWQLEDHRNGVIPKGFTYGTYRVEDINGDGKYTADQDRKIIGYEDPSYRFSIQNTLSYKNWEFKFFINSIQGGANRYYGQPGETLLNPDNIYQFNGVKFDYWTPENPDARYRQLGYYTQALGYGFSPYVQRSFIRLQDVTLSYTVPRSVLNKLKLANLSFFITGKNLLTVTDWDGWDPEIVDKDGNAIGLDLSKSPLMKSYTFGFNFEF